ncbi:NACHT domain-containing protein, partial [candidate division KSB3 bacterium]|nr:NACHT domain-containing protein [candidate division KSB3 bacterium]MBD3326551.1 NACHT domain-containing protein [candidate division KSB3 bacterium]
MRLPVALYNQISDFLKSLPTLDDVNSRRAFIYASGLDPPLIQQIPFDEPPSQFVPLLVSTLLKYGTLNDGRYALVAVLDTARNYVGHDRNAECEVLIAEAATILASQPDDAAEPARSGREYLNRQALLNKVRNYWIRGVLDHSLFHNLPIELKLEERLDAIDFVWETPGNTRQPLPQGVKPITKFDELGVGRTLLILGEAGSGKTTTLLDIARELLERAENDANLPLPVVLNLSSWTHPKQTFDDWLSSEFEAGIYKVSKQISTSWIQHQQLLLLLDGLDEVRPELRESCVNAINQFSQAYGQTEIIVCSRCKEYELLSQHLRFQGALFIQSLTPEQIEDYFAQAGDTLSGVKMALQTDPALQELAKTPLMLSIMALAYQDMPASTFSQMTLEERQHHLWEKYIERAVERKQGTSDYPPGQMLHWLSFLAQKMPQTLFLVEKMNRDWLNPGLQRWVYPLVVGLVAGLSVEWFYGVPLGLIQGGIGGQMLVGLFVGVVVGGLGSLKSNIKLFTAVRWSWSWKRAAKAALAGLVSGPAIGGILWLIVKAFSIETSSVLGFLGYGGVIGVFIAFVSVIFSGIVAADGEVDPNPDDAVHPNQGIRQAAYLSLIATSVTCIVIILPIILLTDWPLPFPCLLGCISLYAGGITCLQHGTLRAMLRLDGKMPWNYIRFLNDSSRCILLYKTGRSYQFVHDLLRQEIAGQYPRKIRHEGHKSFYSKIKIGVISLAAIACFLVSVFFPIRIDSTKITAVEARIFKPRLEVGDRIFLYRIDHHSSHLKRGDIVAFTPTDEMQTDYVR